MKTMLQPISSRSRRSSRSTWACTVTSRAVVGSSAMMRSGSPAMAIAIITRCRRPPESSCGKARIRRFGSGMPTAVSSRSASSSLPAASATCLPIRIVGFSDVIGSWNTAPRSRRRTLRSALASPLTMSEPATVTVPSIARVVGQQPEHAEPENALAGTGLADQAEDLPRRDLRATPRAARGRRDRCAGTSRADRRWLRRRRRSRAPAVSTTRYGPFGYGALRIQRCPSRTLLRSVEVGEAAARPCAARLSSDSFPAAPSPVGVAGVTN